MIKLPHPTTEQISRMSYTKWEGAIRVGFMGILAAIAGFAFSFIVLQPIIVILIPDSTRGFMSLDMQFIIISIILGLGLITISVSIICISSFVLVFKLDANNSYRFTPIIINNCILCLLLAVILFSVFVNYDPSRAYVAFFAIIILIISTIICYCIYRYRYRIDFINTYPGEITLV